MNIQQREEEEFSHTTDAEWDREDARERGEKRPDQAWILSDRDVWHPNPYYEGPPVPHPEDEYPEGAEDRSWWIPEDRGY